jgi:ubiquinone/menaquinone biosynthesis C-methylase UbiE
MTQCRFFHRPRGGVNTNPALVMASLASQRSIVAGFLQFRTWFRLLPSNPMHDEPQTKQDPRSGAEQPYRSKPGFEQEWRSRFIEFADLRDDDAGIAGWSTTGLDARFRFFRSLWQGATPGSIYLDVGCGAGTYTRWLDEQGLSVVGVDYSQPALRKAMARTRADIPFCSADATRLPFADASVDGVLCLGVLQAMQASEPLVQELARVIRDGGMLWIDGLNYHGFTGWWDRTRRKLHHKPMHLRYESTGRLLEILGRAGFPLPALNWLPLMPSRLKILQPAFESRLARRLLTALPTIGSVASHSFLILAQRRR